MTHYLGPVVRVDRPFNDAEGFDLFPSSGPLGGPRFLILHFDMVDLRGDAKLEVELGYDTDVFTSDSGPSFWSRPVDGALSPISIRIRGSSGTARLLEYGQGEPSITPGHAPGTSVGSESNPDVFLHTNPYDEPIYETRLECNPGFAWRNAACDLPTIPPSVKNRVAAATGMIVEVHDGNVSSCSGTLIASDLFLTARHCLTDPSGEDLRSASVTFDYATDDCRGYRRPEGHVTRFFKVLEEVVAGAPPTGWGSTTDWVVVRLEAAPGELPVPLRLRDTNLMIGETIFTMHHPNGAVKKMQAGVYEGGSISGFDYAGGSSGSALFDIDGKLVGGPLSNGSGCGVSYASIASVIAALVAPPIRPVPLDVMIVFDRSGSMANATSPLGRTKLEEAQDAAALFVQLVREEQGDRLGLVTFSSRADPGSLEPAATAKTRLAGPPPFDTGEIGAISAGGSTSIGGGVGTALMAFESGSPNDRAILLLTDGLQNTPPMIESVEGSVGTTMLNVIGFGSDADIDGPLLNRIAREHFGHFTRAVDGLALRKFFGLSFGNIFESGALGDPEFLLQKHQKASDPHQFSVCGEERITIVLGWDDPTAPLRIHVKGPSGKLVEEDGLQIVRGRTWVFSRISLPHNGERDGTWQLIVDRLPIGGEFPPPPTDVRYFFLVIAAGDPKLTYLGEPRRVYTGDPIDPLVGLHYRNGTTPRGQVELSIEVPTVALGQLVAEAGLQPPVSSADPVNAFHTTLQAIAKRAGGVLPVPTSMIHVPLFDDGMHEDGAMEPDGIYNNRLMEIARVEGTYQFRAVARYGEGCVATREAIWSVHVEPGIDPERSDVTVVDAGDQPNGGYGTLVIVPRDRYGNPLGPGRSDRFTVDPIPGVSITGKVKDRKDGSYTIGVTWNGSVTSLPGVVIQQPDRYPVVMTPKTSARPVSSQNCSEAAEKLLGCLGLDDPDVKRVRVKSVCVEIDLKDSKDREDRDC
jgi:hypothetical protein